MVAKAALFKQEIDCVAADYCWGMICAKINNDSGTAIDLLEDYKNLKFQNVMDHAATTWGATNNIIAPAGTGGITEDRKQQQFEWTCETECGHCNLAYDQDFWR